MNKISCTVGILTFNSEKYIRRVLESVKEFGDILICDGGSTDGTVSIAREYGARIIMQDTQFKNPDGTLRDYSGVRNQCISEARHLWFLYVDSDEAVSTVLINEIRDITKKENSCIAYRIPERMILVGKMIEHSSNYPGYQYRLLRTDKDIHFEKTVHERPVFLEKPESVCVLKGPWYVYWDADDIANYDTRVKRYIELERTRAQGMSVAQYLISFLPRNMKSIVGICLRTAYNRMRYSSRTCMPLSVEWGRVRYHGALIATIGRGVFFSQS